MYVLNECGRFTNVTMELYLLYICGRPDQMRCIADGFSFKNQLVKLGIRFTETNDEHDIRQAQTERFLGCRNGIGK